MTEKIARRALLRSALAGGAVLVAGGPALAAATRNTSTSATPTPVPGTTPQMQTLLKYAGEFGGRKYR